MDYDLSTKKGYDEWKEACIRETRRQQVGAPDVLHNTYCVPVNSSENRLSDSERQKISSDDHEKTRKELERQLYEFTRQTRSHYSNQKLYGWSQGRFHNR